MNNNSSNNSLYSTTPKISICIPVYNGEDFISLAIESILKQTFEDFELIISDNASTDRTPEICKEYETKDNRIRYIQQSRNLGGILNFKFLLNEAIGKYFIWMAADDMFGDRQYLEIINKEISDKYDYYFTEVSIIDKEGKIIKSKIMHSFVNCKTRFDFLKASLRVNSHQLYSLFERSKLIEDWKYIEICSHFKSFNEGLFVHAVSAKRTAKFISTLTKFYRQHPKNWSMGSKINKLIYSHVLYSLKTIYFIITLKNYSLYEKFSLFTIELYISFKNLFYFSLASVWQGLNLEEFSLLKKIKKMVYK